MDFKQIRRAQTISPFGVGAVLDIEGESLVAADITYWKGQGDPIHEERLQRRFGVSRFVMAPAAPEYYWDIKEDSAAVPFVRFPTWLFCSNCRTMYRRYSRQEIPGCEKCRNHPTLTPMRFVMACPNGHLSDVPWDYWAHSLNRASRCESPELAFLTTPGGSGLEFVFVKCRSCGAKRNLQRIASPDSLRELGIKCSGHHPWIPWDKRDKSCDAVPQVLQRGATNLTFAMIESSIDIPPHSTWGYYSSDTLRVTNHILFIAIRTAWSSEQTEFFESAIKQLASQEGLDDDLVRSIVLRELGESNVEVLEPIESDNLYEEEFAALTASGLQYDSRDHFIKRDVELGVEIANSFPDNLQSSISILVDQLGGVAQVTKLREVRVLMGFSRLSPPEGMEDLDEEQPGRFSTYSGKKVAARLVHSDLGKLEGSDRWLPAIEVFGEGIFIRFDEEKVRTWETRGDVRNRVAAVIERRKENAAYLPEATPRLLMLHTLAHILIRELSFECGYSIASLRERIYSQEPDVDKPPMAGILIYTASGDSEGTMGGLVRMGEAHRLLPIILKALQVASWCSSDPLCRESRGQGLHALNLAACHSCSLLPETSCVLSNRLLDRVLILGNDETDGFFTPLIDHLMNLHY